ncbi:hypothetical protein RZE82_09070 [Mollicutes bacterium LVI A0039]|nr:hypothetical protein RZE82_09070 [Mollicutes bacterium LVI A0039]
MDALVLQLPKIFWLAEMILTLYIIRAIYINTKVEFAGHQFKGSHWYKNFRYVLGWVLLLVVFPAAFIIHTYRFFFW